MTSRLARRTMFAIPAHIGERAELERLVAETCRRIGPVEVLVCNAAVNPYFGPSKDIPDSAFDKVMSVKLRSNHRLAHLVLPEMVERKDGVIIIVSSVGGLRGSTELGAYAISKAADAADVQLVRNLACEYGPHNIRVNAIDQHRLRARIVGGPGEPCAAHRSRSAAPHRRAGRNRGRRRLSRVARRGIHDGTESRDRRRLDDRVAFSVCFTRPGLINRFGEG